VVALAGAESTLSILSNQPVSSSLGINFFPFCAFSTSSCFAGALFAPVMTII
jgi:hypothetical protein